MSAIEHLLKPHVRDIGEFTVRRLLPAATTQTVGPFIFFDHMGPVVMEAGHGMDVRPHPHIGLATVTYLFEGAILAVLIVFLCLAALYESWAIPFSVMLVVPHSSAVLSPPPEEDEPAAEEDDEESPPALELEPELLSLPQAVSARAATSATLAARPERVIFTGNTSQGVTLRTPAKHRTSVKVGRPRDRMALVR